ncbi:carbon-nitrogen hydrolase [Ilyonectria sp. MPI-CAGE-AT-0026]|nr:carbon-nitrogen hydrolase [Ilyonectria sp. MPI-CAGE-AT-0026]
MLAGRFQLLLLGASTALATSQQGVVPKRDCEVINSTFTLNSQGFYDHLDPENFTVATVVKSPYDGPSPVELFNHPQSLRQGSWNITLTTQRAIEFINKASDNGIGLLVFPEVWFPGYPFTMMSKPELTQSYIDNSLVENDSNWIALVNAIKKAGIYVAIGASERIGDKLHMSQIFWSPEGEKLIHRQKLRASEFERNLWSDGDVDGFKVVPTPYGRIGLLECWEHLHAQMTFPMQAQLEDIHIAMYPNIKSPYEPEDPDKISHPFSSMAVNMAGVHIYSATAKVWSVVAGMDGGIIMNPVGVIQALLPPPTNETHHGPTYLAHSINTTTFRQNRTYEVNSQFGFGSLLEMLQSYPSYISKDRGTFILKKTVTISDLLHLAEKGVKYFSGDDTAEVPL